MDRVVNVLNREERSYFVRGIRYSGGVIQGGYFDLRRREFMLAKLAPNTI